MQWSGAHTDDYSVALSTYGEGVYIPFARRETLSRPGLGTCGSRPKLRCSTAPSIPRSTKAVRRYYTSPRKAHRLVFGRFFVNYRNAAGQISNANTKTLTIHKPYRPIESLKRKELGH